MDTTEINEAFEKFNTTLQSYGCELRSLIFTLPKQSLRLELGQEDETNGLVIFRPNKSGANMFFTLDGRVSDSSQIYCPTSQNSLLPSLSEMNDRLKLILSQLEPLIVV